MSPDAAHGVGAGAGSRTRLFSPLSPEAATALAGYPALLRRALHLTAAMERELPRRIRDLSLSLTAERDGGLKPGYLSDPRTLAAYAWYFLPWNLLRLSRLLPGLACELPDDALVCDVGSGPLTFVQALWLSRPDLRQKRLRFLCTDRSRRALDLGLALFSGLAGFDPTAPDAPWRIRTMRGEYWQGLTGGARLVAMVNVANELAETGREPLDVRMERLAGQLADSLAPGGQVLTVEPGTRLGWRCLASLRTAFLEMGLGLSGPCPHGRECPFSISRVRAWCHFTMSLSGVPSWLSALSERAELGKQRLSLSFLMARAAPPDWTAHAVRTVSGGFSLSDAPGTAAYGCSEKGLVVLVAPDGRVPRPGDLLVREIPRDAPHDAKSGAPRLVLESTGGPAPMQAEAGQREQKREEGRFDRKGPRPTSPAGTGDAAGGPGKPGKSGRPGGPGQRPKAIRPKTSRPVSPQGSRKKRPGKPGKRSGQ